MIGYFPNKSTSKICRKHGDPSVLLDLRLWLCTALRHSGSVSERESSFFSRTSGPRLSTGWRSGDTEIQIENEKLCQWTIQFSYLALFIKILPDSSDLQGRSLKDYWVTLYGQLVWLPLLNATTVLPWRGKGELLHLLPRSPPILSLTGVRYFYSPNYQDKLM